MGKGIWGIIGGIGALLTIIGQTTGITRDIVEIFREDKKVIETQLTEEAKSEGSKTNPKKDKTITYARAGQNSNTSNSRFIRIERNDNLRVYICSNGDRYETNWENESYNGHGTLYFNAGEGKKNEYVGEFEDFKPDGYGTMYYSNHSSLTGNWKAGKYIGK
ncbi:MAG: hypothetical protein ACK5KT_07205 [Dysgonomonas sp.]